MSVLVVERENVTVLSTNLEKTDDGIDIYDDTVTYNVDKEIQKDGDIYVSLKDNITSLNLPVPGHTTLYWKYKRKVNYLRCFDPMMNTATKNANKIEYIVASRYTDTIGFFGLEAQSIKIEIFNFDDETMDTPLKIYEEITAKRDVYNYTSYATALPEFQRVLAVDIFAYPNAKLKITMSSVDATVSIGNIVYGRKYDLGLMLSEPKPILSTRNIFSKERDATTGEIQVTPTIIYKELTMNVITSTSGIERTENKLEQLNGKACLFIGLRKSDSLPNIMIYGFHEDFDTAIGLDHTIREITIKGVF